MYILRSTYVQISVSMNLPKSLNYVIQVIGRSSSLIERIETKGRFKLLSWLSVSVISIVVLVVSIVAVYAKRFKVKMRYYISCIPWKTMASNSQKENSNCLAKKKKILFHEWGTVLLKLSLKITYSLHFSISFLFDQKDKNSTEGYLVLVIRFY